MLSRFTGWGGPCHWHISGPGMFRVFEAKCILNSLAEVTPVMAKARSPRLNATFKGARISLNWSTTPFGRARIARWDACSTALGLNREEVRGILHVINVARTYTSVESMMRALALKGDAGAIDLIRTLAEGGSAAVEKELEAWRFLLFSDQSRLLAAHFDVGLVSELWPAFRNSKGERLKGPWQDVLGWYCQTLEAGYAAWSFQAGHNLPGVEAVMNRAVSKGFGVITPLWPNVQDAEGNFRDEP